MLKYIVFTLTLANSWSAGYSSAEQTILAYRHMSVGGSSIEPNLLLVLDMLDPASIFGRVSSIPCTHATRSTHSTVHYSISDRCRDW